MHHAPTSSPISHSSYRPRLVLCCVLSVFFLPAANAEDVYELFDLSEDVRVCEDDTKLPTGFHYQEYTADCQHNQNLAVITDGNTYGFADTKGKVVILPTFEDAYGFDEGLALVKQRGKYGYINPKGDFVIEPSFEDAWGFWEGRAKIAQNGKYGFIDKQGKITVKPTFDDTGNWFENGLVSVKVGERWGFIDKNGQTKIAPTYDYVEDFSEQLAVVGKDTGKTDEEGNRIYQYGYINPKGKTALPMKYDLATAFMNGSAMVVVGDDIYFINKKGERVEPQL